MLWIVIALGLLALGGLALFIRLVALKRPSRVAVVVMVVALLIALSCLLLVESMLPAAAAAPSTPPAP